MPHKGYTDKHGVNVPFDEIDIVKDAERFNASPCTLAHLVRLSGARSGLGFTASQIDDEPRQSMLKATRDYYTTTGEAMSAYGGTLKHEQINIDHPSLIVEKRFHSKRIPGLSGQIDHGAIISVDSRESVLLCDLYDLKSCGWYKAKKAAQDVWKGAWDYAMQISLCAIMMEENGYEGLSIQVRKLYLEFVPRDSSYKHKGEADRLGLPEHQKIIVEVPRKPDAWIYAEYERAIAAREAAIAVGYAPICKETWSSREVSHLRCRYYCPVKAQCIELAKEKGERHPLVTTDEMLEEQLKRSLTKAKDKENV